METQDQESSREIPDTEVPRLVEELEKLPFTCQLEQSQRLLEYHGQS